MMEDKDAEIRGDLSRRGRSRGRHSISHESRSESREKEYAELQATEQTLKRKDVSRKLLQESPEMPRCADTVTVADLKQRLKSLGLPTTGKKQTLLKRLEQSTKCSKCSTCESLKRKIAEWEQLVKTLRPPETSSKTVQTEEKAKVKSVTLLDLQLVVTSDRFSILCDREVDTDATDKHPPSDTLKKKKKKKIVLLMSSHGRGCSDLLRNEVGSNFDVCGIVKPGAPLREVVKDAPALTMNADAVVIVGGTNDVSAGSLINWSKLNEVLPDLKNKKVTMSELLPRFDDPVANYRTSCENRRLQQQNFNRFENEEQLSFPLLLALPSSGYSSAPGDVM